MAISVTGLHKLTTLAAGMALAAGALAEELTVWVIDGHAERPFFVQLAKAFERDHADSGVRLSLQAIPGYNNAIEVAWLGGRLPDVVMVDGPNMARYAWHGMLQPIDGLIDADTLAQLLDGVVAQGRYPPDGRLYMLGAGDSSAALWANRAYLERAGIAAPRALEEAWDYEEFTAVLDKLSRVEGVRWPLDFKLGYKGEWRTWGYYPLLRSAGERLMDERRWRARGVLDSPATQRAAAKLREWVEHGYVVPASAGDNRFLDRGAALSWAGNWVFRGYQQALGDDLVALPAPRLGARAYACNGGWGWAVPAGREATSSVGLFLNYVLSKRQVIEWSKATGYTPARRDAIAEMPLFAPGGLMGVFAEQAAKAYLLRPVHPGYPVVSREFGKAIANIFAGADIALALGRAADEIDWDIEDNHGYPPFGAGAHQRR